MALLDGFNYAALPFNAAYPSDVFGEADSAQSAREAAALRLARRFRGASPEAVPSSPFDTGVAPLSLAGPGVYGLDPSLGQGQPAAAGQPTGPQAAAAPASPFETGAAPLNMAGFSAPKPQVAPPASSPTDLSSSNRRPGQPLNIAPQIPQEAPGFIDRVTNGIANNPMTLLTLGAGIAQGGIGRGLQFAASGMQADKANQQKTLTQNATVTALRARGVPDADIALAQQSPDAMKTLLARIYPDPTKAPHTVTLTGPDGSQRLATWDQKKQQYAFQDQPDAQDGHPNYGLGKSGTQELDKSRADRIAGINAGGSGADTLSGSVSRAMDVVRNVLQDGDIGGVAAIPGVRTAATVFGTESEGRRQRLDAALNAIKLAQSQAELKGQGAVSDRERELVASLAGGANTINRQTLLENLQELQDIQRGKQWYRDQYQKIGGDPFAFDKEYGPKLEAQTGAWRRERGGNAPTLPAVPQQPTGSFRVMGVR